MPGGNIASTIGSREATTGLPMAAYSKILVDRLKSVNSVRRVGASPMSAAASAPRHVLDGIAAVEHDAVRDPEGRGLLVQRHLGEVAPVELQRDGQVRPSAAIRATASSATSISYTVDSAPA